MEGSGMKRMFVFVILLATTLVGVGPAALPASGVSVTATCPEMTDSVSRLYQAYFLRESDADGFAFWVDQYASGSRNIRQISEAFEKVPEFVATYGELDNTQLVNLVYQNVLSREPDVEGGAFWLGRLEGGYPRGAMMIGFSESEEYVLKTGTVRSLAGYGRIYPVGTTWSCGKGSAEFDITQPRGNSRFEALALNRNTETARVIIDTASSSGTALNRLLDSEMGPDFLSLRWPIAANPPTAFPSSTRRLKIFASLPETHWTVVFYPTAIAADKPGWDDPDKIPNILDLRPL
jgi:hypothetical protein